MRRLPTEKPTPEELAVALALPHDVSFQPNFHGMGSWIEHLTAPRADLLSNILRESLDLSQTSISRLFEFGAVYTCPVPPQIPDALLSALPSEQVEEIARRRHAASLTRTARDTRDTTLQRITSDALVPEHSYVRVHLLPKRFPNFHFTDWPSRLIAVGEDFVVINKPPHLPAVPTVDNLCETALAGAARAVGASHPLLTTSRLDHATEGVLVVGKTTDFVRRFNDRLARGIPGNVKKFYKALVAAPPPSVGSMRHYVRLRCRRPGSPFFTLVLGKHDTNDGNNNASFSPSPDGSLACELKILGREKVSLCERAANLFGVKEAYEVSIELVSGRTHQIRAQLSAAGHPLLGDALYGPLADAELRKRFEEGDETLEIADSRGVRLLAEPDGPIGLQASRLEVTDGSLFGAVEPVVFKADSPWWKI